MSHESPPGKPRGLSCFWESSTKQGERRCVGRQPVLKTGVALICQGFDSSALRHYFSIIIWLIMTSVYLIDFSLEIRFGELTELVRCPVANRKPSARMRGFESLTLRHPPFNIATQAIQAWTLSSSTPKASASWA